MVFRLEKRWQWILPVSLILTVLFLWPYLFKDLLPLEHDTLFHLSRIEGMAESISRGAFFPRIYPYKNNGFGYGSPMFYNDLFLIPFSLLYLHGVSLAVCYKTLIAVITFASALAMCDLISTIFDDPWAAVICAAAFLFSNYRITDVYVRGAVGEAMAMIFLIILVKALYLLFENQNPSGWKTLWLALCGLLCSHNLTALLGMILTGIVWLCYIPRTSKQVQLSFFKSLLLSFLSTAWFTLPMIEQLRSQRFYLHYYASNSALEQYAMPLWKYFVNKTVFGYGSNTLSRDMQMNVNIGCYLMLVPLLYWLIPSDKRKAGTFILVFYVIGAICLILPWDAIPWQYLSALRILQFPWRLMTVAAIALCLPSAAAVQYILADKRWLKLGVVLVLSAEGMVHVLPVMDRTFGITSSTAYEELLSGELIDPYYSATYVRVELAGGDYLPSGSPDFRIRPSDITDLPGNALNIPFVKDGTSLTFSVIDSSMQDVVLPLTFYKGYTCIDEEGNEIPLSLMQGLIRVSNIKEGTYQVFYRGTPCQKYSMILSLSGTLLVLAAFLSDKRK